MRRARTASCSLLLLATAIGTAHAAPPPAPAPGTLGAIRAVELAIETRAANVSLPAAGTGPLLVSPCGGCVPLTLAADARSAWLLGQRPVPVAQLRAALLAKPQSGVLLVYERDSRRLVRLVTHAH